MRGSVAIWHDTLSIDADGYSPRVEVHINIWRSDRRTAGDHFDLFDIGLRFKEVRALQSLSMSLPFEIGPNNVLDLFELMHDASTVSAIFNETLTPTAMLENGNCFPVTHAENKKTQVYIWRCPESARQFSTIGSGNDRGTIITIGDEFFRRLQGRVGDHYVRLRIKVPVGLRNGFVSTNDPKDSAFLSTISTNEIVEFRLNERRNFSPEIRSRLEANNCGLIDISAVHYFLIRDMGVEMTQSHAGFRKMRRLEPDMWERYLTGCDDFTSPDRMIIYHWAAFADHPSGRIESFNALATFRAYYTGSLWIYGLVIVALGAMGSAVQSIGAGVLSAFLDSVGLPCGPTYANMSLLAVLLLILSAMVLYKHRKATSKLSDS